MQRQNLELHEARHRVPVGCPARLPQQRARRGRPPASATLSCAHRSVSIGRGRDTDLVLAAHVMACSDLLAERVTVSRRSTARARWASGVGVPIREPVVGDSGGGEFPGCSPAWLDWASRRSCPRPRGPVFLSRPRRSFRRSPPARAACAACATSSPCIARCSTKPRPSPRSTASQARSPVDEQPTPRRRCDARGAARRRADVPTIHHGDH